MSYLIKRFESMSGANSVGNTLVNKLNQWLAFNPAVVPIQLEILWPDGGSRKTSYVLTMMYRQGGPLTRFWSSQFQRRPLRSVEQVVRDFLLLNPTLIPVVSLPVERPGAPPILTRSILMIYAVSSWAQIAPGPRAIVGTPQLPVGVGSYGDFGDAGDPSRPVVSALNLGNVNWPAGATGLLFSTTTNNPDRDTLAGIAPCCAGGPVPVPPPVIVPDQKCVECFPPRVR